ncbi:MAG: retropepsin-like aspartic protease family protein [Caulobacteraceae bacterium]
MSDYPGPWGELKPAPRPRGPGQRIAHGVAGRLGLRERAGLILWVALMVLAGVAFAILSKVYPERFTRDEDFDALYLFGFLALVSTGLVASRTLNWRRGVRHLFIWTAIVAVLLTVYTVKDRIARLFAEARSEIVPAAAVKVAPKTTIVTRGEDGAFYIFGRADGVPLKFLIDTGSTDVVLSPADAERLGLSLSSLRFTRPSQTANGVGSGAPFVIRRLGVGPIALLDVRAEINARPMPASLLGMTFLKRLKSYEVVGDRMILKGP